MHQCYVYLCVKACCFGVIKGFQFGGGGVSGYFVLSPSGVWSLCVRVCVLCADKCCATVVASPCLSWRLALRPSLRRSCGTSAPSTSMTSALLSLLSVCTLVSRVCSLLSSNCTAAYLTIFLMLVIVYYVIVILLWFCCAVKLQTMLEICYTRLACTQGVTWQLLMCSQYRNLVWVSDAVFIYND